MKMQCPNCKFSFDRPKPPKECPNCAITFLLPPIRKLHPVPRAEILGSNHIIVIVGGNKYN